MTKLDLDGGLNKPTIRSNIGSVTSPILKRFNLMAQKPTPPSSPAPQPISRPPGNIQNPRPKPSAKV